MDRCTVCVRRMWQKGFESGYYDVLISTPLSERRIGFVNRLAYLVATGAGAGLMPFAPGTFGSVAGVAIFVAMSAAAHPDSDHHNNYWLLLAAIHFLVFRVVGWASTRP